MNKNLISEMKRLHLAGDLATVTASTAPRPHLVSGDHSRLVDDLPASEDAICQQLTLILSSPLFSRSERLSRFLRFTIEYALCGRQDDLKEYLIGTEVYDRRPPYDPNQDSIVRTEARRLRSKLKEYYDRADKNDRIFIYFRLGSYVPVFRVGANPTAEPTVAATISLERSLIQPSLTNQRIAQRESLYSDFIQEASRLYANSLVHSLKDLNDLVSLNALVSRIRLFASDPVLLAAETVVKQIICQYAKVNISLEELLNAALSAKADPLETFSVACREEFQNIARSCVSSFHSVIA